MLGRVRTGQNHSLCSVNTAMFLSRNDETLLSLSAIPAGFSSLPDLSRGDLVLDGKPGEAAELLHNVRPRAELSTQFAQTLFVHFVCWFSVAGSFLLEIQFCIFPSQKHHLGAHFNLAQSEMKQVGIRHLQQPT